MNWKKIVYNALITSIAGFGVAYQTTGSVEGGVSGAITAFVANIWGLFQKHPKEG